MKKIVVWDHVRAERMSLTKSLKELGFDEVEDCADGDVAVKRTLDQVPDMVILDASQPGTDGIAAAERIRDKLKIPIMLLVPAADADLIARAKKADIAGCLVKPLRNQDLLPAIELAFAHNDQIEQLKEKVEDLKETLESRKIVEKAKGILMRNGLSEPEAFRRMQKLSMDKRKSMRQIAEAILLTE